MSDVSPFQRVSQKYLLFLSLCLFCFSGDHWILHFRMCKITFCHNSKPIFREVVKVNMFKKVTTLAYVRHESQFLNCHESKPREPKSSNFFVTPTPFETQSLLHFSKELLEIEVVELSMMQNMTPVQRLPVWPPDWHWN